MKYFIAMCMIVYLLITQCGNVVEVKSYSPQLIPDTVKFYCWCLRVPRKDSLIFYQPCFTYNRLTANDIIRENNLKSTLSDTSQISKFYDKVTKHFDTTFVGQINNIDARGVVLMIYKSKTDTLIYDNQDMLISKNDSSLRILGNIHDFFLSLNPNYMKK
jgi:hypothetical protein